MIMSPAVNSNELEFLASISMVIFLYKQILICVYNILMLKLIFSSKNKRKKYVVFYPNLRCLSSITCKSFETIEDAVDWAWNHNDMWIGNCDVQFIDYINEVNHPILRGKKWNFA
jgi:hypothetical protein